MKGEIGLLLVAVVTSLILAGVMFDVLSLSSSEISIVAKEKEILTAIDELEVVKQGIPYMLNYSFYQAAYEVAGKGGYLDSAEYEALTGRNLDNEPCWRIYARTYFPRYLDALEKKMKEIVNEYVSAVKELLPEYSFINVMLFYYNNELQKAELVAKSHELLSYRGKDFVVYDNPNVTQDLDLTFFKMFKLAKEKFVDFDSIKKAIIDSEPEDKCKHASIGDVCEYSIDPEGWLSNNCPNIDENFKQSIKSSITNIGGSNEFCSISLEPLEVKVKHTSTYTYESKQESFDKCGCKQWGSWIDTGHKEETSDACKSYCEKQGYEDGMRDDESGNCLCRDCEKAYEVYYGVEYSYEYKGAAKVKVNITSKESFPIPAGKISLVFYVVSSNEYNYQPI